MKSRNESLIKLYKKESSRLDTAMDTFLSSTSWGKDGPGSLSDARVAFLPFSCSFAEVFVAKDNMTGQPFCLRHKSLHQPGIELLLFTITLKLIKKWHVTKRWLGCQSSDIWGGSCALWEELLGARLQFQKLQSRIPWEPKPFNTCIYVCDPHFQLQCPVSLSPKLLWLKAINTNSFTAKRRPERSILWSNLSFKTLIGQNHLLRYFQKP